WGGDLSEARRADAQGRGAAIRPDTRFATRNNHGWYAPPALRTGRRLPLLALLRRAGVLARNAVHWLQSLRAPKRNSNCGVLRRRADRRWRNLLDSRLESAIQWANADLERADQERADADWPLT